MFKLILSFILYSLFYCKSSCEIFRNNKKLSIIRGNYLDRLSSLNNNMISNARIIYFFGNV